MSPTTHLTIRIRLLDLTRSQRGITGLETAIILIAFVVVASVFAYAILIKGVSVSQKSSDSVSAAIGEVRSSVVTRGSTIAYAGQVDTDGLASTTADEEHAVVRLDVTIAVALAGVPVDVTPAYQIDATNKQLERSTAANNTNTLVIDFLDQSQIINDAAWTVSFAGKNDGDNSLEPTERAVLTIWLVEYDYDTPEQKLYYNLGTDRTDPFIDDRADLLQNFDSFTLGITPVQGAPLSLEKVIPQSLNSIMNLR